jgi:hypothetical protein
LDTITKECRLLLKECRRKENAKKFMKGDSKMKKSISVFCLFMLCSFVLYSCRSQKPEKPKAPKTLEMEKKLIGKWKFLFTDAAEEIPPEDLAYSFLEDHTCVLEYTGEKEKKERIEGTYEVNDGVIQTFRDGAPSKEFHVLFEGENRIKLTEKDSKNAIVLEKIK